MIQIMRQTSMHALRTLLTLSCLALSLTVLASLGGCAARRGPLIPIGGSLDAANTIAFEAMLAGLPRHPTIIIAPFASAEPDESWERARAMFEQHAPGARIERMRDPSLGHEDEQAAVRQLHAAHLLFFTGGDQSRIMQRMWSAPMLVAVFRRDLRVAGTSAGAAAMSHPMFVGGTSEQALTNAPHDDESTPLGKPPGPRTGVRLNNGMVLGTPMLFDTHALARGRYGRMLAALRKQHHLAALGLADASGAVVEQVGGTTTIRMLHDHGGVLAWLESAESKFWTDSRKDVSQGLEPPGVLDSEGARISLLHAGDVAELSRASRARAAGKAGRGGVGSDSSLLVTRAVLRSSGTDIRELPIRTPGQQPSVREPDADARAYDDGVLQALLGRLARQPDRMFSVDSERTRVRVWADSQTRFALHASGVCTVWAARIAIDVRSADPVATPNSALTPVPGP
jgi:cyanophycinase